MSNWVSTQRQEYKSLRKGGQSKCLNEERVRLLDSIGFIWKAQRGGPKRERNPVEGIVLHPSSNGQKFAPAIVTATASVRRCTAKRLLHFFARGSIGSIDNTVTKYPDAVTRSNATQIINSAQGERAVVEKIALLDHMTASQMDMGNIAFRTQSAHSEAIGVNALLQNRSLTIGSMENNIHFSHAPQQNIRIANGGMVGNSDLSTLFGIQSNASTQLLQAKAYQQRFGNASAAVTALNNCLQPNLANISTPLWTLPTMPSALSLNAHSIGLSARAQLQLRTAHLVQPDPTTSLLRQLTSSQNSNVTPTFFEFFDN